MAEQEDFSPEDRVKIHKIFLAVLTEIQGIEFGIAMAALADAIGYAVFKASEGKPHLLQRNTLESVIQRQIGCLAYMQAQPPAASANVSEVGHG